MWEVTRKGLVAHKFRLLLTSISIVLGVAFVAGTFVFTDTIGSVFDHLFTQTTSGTDAVVRASLPFKVNTQVGLDETTAKKAKVDVGDTVRVVFLTVPPEEFKVSAVFKFGDAGNLAGATLAAFEPGTAQRVLNKIGVWDEIDAAAKSGVSQEQLRDALSTKLRQAGLADRYESVTQKALAKETANDIKQGLSFFNTFLLIFALVALFVGSFIIYNTFSIIVAQRTRELGLLKAVGATGRQVTGSVAIEALAVGVFSSVVVLVF